MVIDTSALVAILLQEDGAADFTRTIKLARTRALSAVSRVELAFVMENRKPEGGRKGVEAVLVEAQIEVAAITPAQAEIAVQAFRRFGKGRHPAGLNLGDCFSYALAKALNEPLLFKGDDFAKTDVVSALARGSGP